MDYKPTSEAELSEIVKATTNPLAIVGGGTRRARPVKGDMVSTAGISGIVDYEPGALTMVARAGTPLFEIEATLAKENQQLAFEPLSLAGILGSSGHSTIGGVFAANASGSRRIQAGAARDFLLGVRFVDGAGKIVKNGGRVMKNVTGYDLVKLLAGSWGTLGILSEVSFKVLPISDVSATLSMKADDPKTAIDIMTTCMNTAFDVTGAAYDAVAGCVYIRIEGFEKSVAYRSGALQQIVSKFGAVDILEMTASRAVWTQIQNLYMLQNRDGDLWRVSVKPTDGANVVHAISPDAYVMDWSGGSIWMRVSKGMDVRGALGSIAGHATCYVGDAAMFHPEPENVRVLTDAIRRKYDPKAILNQGLMG